MGKHLQLASLAGFACGKNTNEVAAAQNARIAQSEMSHRIALYQYSIGQPAVGIRMSPPPHADTAHTSATLQFAHTGSASWMLEQFSPVL